jgi:hypothetical protein
MDFRRCRNFGPPGWNRWIRSEFRFAWLEVDCTPTVREGIQFEMDPRHMSHLSTRSFRPEFFDCGSTQGIEIPSLTVGVQ